MRKLSKKEENLLHLFSTSGQFPKGDPDNPKTVESLVKKRYLRYRPSGRLETTKQGADYVDIRFLDMPLGPGQVFLQGQKLGNPPFSPYHHKTEAPGMPGHHRLSGFNRKLAKAIGLI